MVIFYMIMKKIDKYTKRLLLSYYNISCFKSWYQSTFYYMFFSFPLEI